MPGILCVCVEWTETGRTDGRRGEDSHEMAGGQGQRKNGAIDTRAMAASYTALARTQVRSPRVANPLTQSTPLTSVVSCRRQCTCLTLQCRLSAVVRLSVTDVTKRDTTAEPPGRLLHASTFPFSVPCTSLSLNHDRWEREGVEPSDAAGSENHRPRACLHHPPTHTKQTDRQTASRALHPISIIDSQISP